MNFKNQSYSLFVGSFLPHIPERTLMCEHFLGQQDEEEEVREMLGVAMTGKRGEGMEKRAKEEGEIIISRGRPGKSSTAIMNN